MDQDPSKLRQLIHEKGRWHLSLGRRVQEITDPAELKAVQKEQKSLLKEIMTLKATVARIENS